MNKKILSTLIVLALGTLSVCAVDLQPINNYNSGNSSSSGLDKNTIYYPNANLKSAIKKYKGGNYTGCLQELFSLTKKEPSNAAAYYYMALAYTHVNMQSDAVEAYEKVISLSPNSYLAEYATKGKDCLTGGPTCKAPEATGEDNNVDALDQFVNAPYGNGLSPELNRELQQKELNNIQKEINNKENLEYKDIQKIRNFDNDKSSAEENDRIAQVSDEEVLNAIKTLKDAGVNVSLQNQTPYSVQYQDPQMAEFSMMLGNNNNNNGSMMNMVPYLMARQQEGKNVDPRLMQAMIMNSMMTDFTFSNNNNNRY